MTDTFYWNYSGQTHYYEDMFELLTIGLLEESPQDYLELLRRSAQWNMDETRKILDDTSSYDTWYSPHPICLVFLVGDQSDSTKMRASTTSPNSWYGQHKASFSEDLGIEIFTEMVRIGANLSIKNFSNKDIFQVISNTPETSWLAREKIDRFKELVISHYMTQRQ